MKALRIPLIIIAVMIALVAAFYLVGHFASRNYKGKVSEKIEAPRTKIWTLLNDIDGLPSRRKEIVKVEHLGKNDKGFNKWKEYTDMGGNITFEITELIPEEKLVVNMKESTFGMSGNWTYELKDEGQGTKITVTEESNTDDIWVRSVMTLAGRDANLKMELEMIEEGTKGK